MSAPKPQDTSSDLSGMQQVLDFIAGTSLSKQSSHSTWSNIETMLPEIVETIQKDLVPASRTTHTPQVAEAMNAQDLVEHWENVVQPAI